MAAVVTSPELRELIGAWPAWVRCAERMPEGPGIYAVAGPPAYAGRGGPARPLLALAYYDPARPCILGPWVGLDPAYAVTRWYPLPLPPEEDAAP